MSYDEEHQRKSRVVVETPNARREVVQTHTSRVPEERKGVSTGVVAVVALVAVAATALIFLFLMNPSEDEANTNVNITARSTPLAQPSVVYQQAPTQPTPIIIEVPSQTQPAPIIMTPPAETTAPAAPPPASDPLSVQNNVSRKIQDDAELAATDIIATVSDNKATLTGTVNTPDLKRRAERLAMTVKGVRTVDNQIKVAGGAEALPSP